MFVDKVMNSRFIEFKKECAVQNCFVYLQITSSIKQGSDLKKFILLITFSFLITITNCNPYHEFRGNKIKLSAKHTGIFLAV